MLAYDNLPMNIPLELCFMKFLSRQSKSPGSHSMKFTIPVLAVLCFPAMTLAQDTGHLHSPGMDHSAHMAQSNRLTGQPTEPGQSAFAAIQEIVGILEADPSTDWSRVDIEGLRQHLIDMNNVTLAAEISAEPIDGGMRYTVTGAGPVKDSIRRMTTAHAATINGVNGWNFTVQEHPQGVVFSVTVANPDDVAKLQALGFIGVMTRGMHHQEHHLMIATGHSPHP
jgi:hypothetical protein